MYHPLSLNGYNKIINAVKRQRNLGLLKKVLQKSLVGSKLDIFFLDTCIGYSTNETKEVDRIGYNGFLFPHEYSGESLGANSFVSIIMYLTCTIIVLLKKYMVWHIVLHF